MWDIKPLLLAGQAFPGQESKGTGALCLFKYISAPIVHLH